MPNIPPSMTDDDETWKPMPGWEDTYFISDRGRVWARSRKVPCDYTDRWGNHVTERRKAATMLTERMTTHGYVQYNLKLGSGVEGGRDELRTAHSLVMEAFGPERPPEADVINHINGDKADNRIENLEWATERENRLHKTLMHHAAEHGLDEAEAQLQQWLRALDDKKLATTLS